MVDMGREVPAPAFNMDDFLPASASGKVLARMPRSMHLQLAARAKTEGVSLNALVLAFIAEGLACQRIGGTVTLAGLAGSPAEHGAQRDGLGRFIK